MGHAHSRQERRRRIVVQEYNPHPVPVLQSIQEGNVATRTVFQEVRGQIVGAEISQSTPLPPIRSAEQRNRQRDEREAMARTQMQRPQRLPTISTGYASFLSGHKSSTTLNLEDEEWQTERSHKTYVYSTAWNVVNQTFFIFICGKPGTGKTHIGRHLQKDLKEKIGTIEQVSVKSLAEVLQNIDMEKNQVFFLDDVFGSLTPNDEANQWFDHIHVLIKKLKEQASIINLFKTFVIITSRSAMIPLRIRQYCSIDLDDSKYKLENPDKNSIFNIVRNTENIENEQLKSANTHDNIGFPLCAYIHVHFFNHKNISEFFVKPLKHVLQIVNTCLDDTELCKAFYVMAMNNGRICKHFLSLNMLNVGPLSFENADEHYFNCVNMRCACITRTVNNGYIEFFHPEVLEVVERSFIIKHKDEALKYVSFKAICSTVFLRRETEFLSSRLYLRPTDSAIGTIVSRSFESVCNGFIFQPCNLDLWKHQTVCEKFIHILDSQQARSLCKFFLSEDKNHGDRILYWTAKLHKRDLCKVLVEFLKRRNLKEIDTSKLLSEALIGACSIVQLELVHYIVACGADVSYCRGCVDQSHAFDDIACHDCPIEAAYRSNNFKALQFLLKQKAIIRHSKWKYWNIFHIAMEYCNDSDILNVLRFVRSLCQSHYEVSIITDAMHAANWDDINDIFYTLVSYDLVNIPMYNAFLKLDVDMNYRGKDGSFVLLHFLKLFEQRHTQSRYENIVICLSQGANPNLIASNDTYALLLVFKMQPFCFQLLNELLKYNAYPDIRGADGSNCLHLCVYINLDDEHMKEVLSKLVEFGADRTVRMIDGLSPVQLLVQVQTNPEEYIESLRYLSENCLTEILSFRLSKEKVLKTVLSLLDNGCDVQRANENAETCLSLAISFYPSIVRRLLDRGANPTCLDGNGRTMIERALLSDNKDMSSVVDLLLESDQSSPVCIHRYFLSAFMSKHNRYQEICNLLHKFPNTAVELKDDYLQTFLHLSVSSNLLDDEVFNLAKKFKELKGNLNCVDSNHTSAIDLAAKSSKLRSVTILYLIQHSNIDIVQRDFLYNCCSNNHVTIELLKYLDSRKMLSKYVTNSRQILHKLAANKEMLPHTIDSIVRTLVNSVVSFKLLNEYDLDSNSALHVAAQYGNLSMITCLCNLEINVNHQNRLGNTALHELIAAQSIDDINARNMCSAIVKVVKPIFNWSLRNSHKMTVIEILLTNIEKSCSRKETLVFILSTCKNVNETFKEKSMLHYVLDMDKSDYYVSQLVDLILLRIPGPDVTDNCQRTALNAAAKNKYHCRLRSMLQLLKKGANPNTVDNIKQNPLMNSIKSPRGNVILSEAERLFRVVILLIFKCDKNRKSLEEETPRSLSNDYDDIKNFLLWEAEKPKDALELVKFKSKTIAENMTKTIDCPILDLELVSSSDILNQCFQHIAEAYPYMAAKPLAYDVYGVKAQVPVTDDFLYESGSQNYTNDSTDESDDNYDSFIPEESVAIRNI